MYVKFIDTEIYGKIIQTHCFNGTFEDIKYYTIKLARDEDTFLEEIYEDIIEHISAEEYLASEILDG